MASKIDFKYENCTDTPPAGDSTSFKLTTSASIDIWRKPPSLDVFNAPILYKPILISSFRRARVTVSANWQTLYDQGGLVFIMPQADGSKKWIKSGIEYYKDEVFVSTVAADNVRIYALNFKTPHSVQIFDILKNALHF